MSVYGPPYSTGTVTVDTGSKLLSGAGTAWDLALIAGGLIEIDGAGIGGVSIASVESETAATLAFNWPGPPLVNVNYRIWPVVAQAADAIEANAHLVDIARKLRAGMLAIRPNANGTLAQRAAYDDEPPPFFFLRDGDASPPVMYSKLSAASGDWSAGWTVKGDKGDEGNPGTGDAYDIIVDDPGKPGSGEELLVHKFANAVSFGADMAGSQVYVPPAALPTDPAIYSFTKNGIEFATLTIAIDGTPTFTGTTVFQAGDVLRVIAPDPRDETLSGVSMTLAGNRA
jgi:hypothetical protein